VAVKMRVLWSRLWFFVVLLVTVHATTRQAPGDEDAVCVGINEYFRIFVNQEVLISSFNYFNLLEPNGGPWAAIDLDGDDMSSVSEVYKILIISDLINSGMKFFKTVRKWPEYVHLSPCHNKTIGLYHSSSTKLRDKEMYLLK